MQRACAPRETLARLRPLLHGMGITRVANVTGLDRTGIPVVMVCRPASRSLTVSQGKGLTLEAAKVSGIMEAAELWHAERITRPIKLASCEELSAGHRVADVDALPRPPDSRFTRRLPLLWIEGEDLLGGGRAWLPFELVSTNYTLPLPPGSGSFAANSNGLACGNDAIEAASHALCEVVERDATARWQRLSPRERAARLLDLDSVDDSACRRVLAQLAGAGLAVHVWETTREIGIASFACLLAGPPEDRADPELGAGCHPAREVALLRALTEAAQARTTYIAGARDDYSARLYDARERALRRARCAALLQPAAQPRAFGGVPHFEAANAAEELRWILSRLRAAGLREAVAVDLTREPPGIPVVRVVVPGLEGPAEEAA
jgi:ribosomal protein S12 methylthiotransferase accessory factor